MSDIGYGARCDHGVLLDQHCYECAIAILEADNALLRDALEKIRDCINPHATKDSSLPVGNVKRFRDWAIEALAAVAK